MMEKRHGLGRGLGALLGDPAQASGGMQDILLDRIDPNPQQPRRTFSEDGLRDLEGSIRELGVLVPIIVRAKGDRFELIAGERRCRAARSAGLRRIPAILKDATDERSLEFAVVENLQRENLDPIEEAMGFAHLMRDYSFSQEKLAGRLGKSRPAITNSLRLLDLADDVKAMVQRGDISAGHARALLPLPDERRRELAQKIAADGLSVREIERIVRKEKLQRDVATPNKRAVRAGDVDRDELEERLRQRFAAMVRVIGRDKGQVEIVYSNSEDLTRIVDVLLGEVE